MTALCEAKPGTEPASTTSLTTARSPSKAALCRCVAKRSHLSSGENNIGRKGSFGQNVDCAKNHDWHEIRPTSQNRRVMWGEEKGCFREKEEQQRETLWYGQVNGAGRFCGTNKLSGTVKILCRMCVWCLCGVCVWCVCTVIFSIVDANSRLAGFDTWVHQPG